MLKELGASNEDFGAAFDKASDTLGF